MFCVMAELRRVFPSGAAPFLAALGLERGLLCGVGGVGDGIGDAVLVAADAFVFDCFFEE
jgi:hypothetical protein